MTLDKAIEKLTEIRKKMSGDTNVMCYTGALVEEICVEEWEDWQTDKEKRVVIY